MNMILQAFLNTLLPAMLLVGAVAFVSRWFNAATRYAAWWVTLFAVLLLPLLYTEVTVYAPAPAVATEEIPAEVSSGPSSFVKVDSGRDTSWVAFVWMVGALLMAVRIATSYRSLRRMKLRAVPLAVAERESSRALRVLASNEVTSPIAVGFWHPAIIVPADLAPKLSLSELDGVLLHEYAHLARRDDWMNLLGRMLEAVLWFHPVARFILGRMALARELACDEWVVYQTGNVRAYAATLLKLTELRCVGGEQILATGILGRKPQLSYRIEQLLRLGLEKIPSVSFARLTGVGVVALSLVLVGVQAPRLIAFEKKAPPPAPAPVVKSPSRPGYLAGLQAAGYTKLDVDEIIDLKNNGVTTQYIAGMTTALGLLTPQQLIELHHNGVRVSDIGRAKKLMTNVSVEQIVKFKHSGVLEKP